MQLSSRVLTTLDSPNKRNSKSIIGILHDELLISILCRVPYETVNSSCKRVSKRWRALISNSSFVNCYLDHKTKTSLPPESTSFMLERTVNETEHETSFVTVSNKDGKFVLPKFTLSFLPCQVKVAATFKDLVLCYKYEHTSKKHDMKREYYICNPLTRQWVTLPPIILPPYYDNETDCCAALICEEPPSDNVKHDYRFRVVVMLFPSLELMVFCSEIGQWKNILLTLDQTTTNIMLGNEGVVVVCNKIVYFGYKSSFGEFDPFCIDIRVAATLDAKPLPSMHKSFPFKMTLAECRGRLLGIKSYRHVLFISKLSDDDNGSGGRSWESELPVVFVRLKESGFDEALSFKLAGVHPKNEEEEEIYLVIKYGGPDQAEQLVACEYLHRPAIKPLTPRLQRGVLSSARHRLRLLPSPTPLPRMIHS